VAARDTAPGRRTEDSIAKLIHAMKFDWLKVFLLLLSGVAAWSKMEQSVADIRVEVQRLETRLDNCSSH